MVFFCYAYTYCSTSIFFQQDKSTYIYLNHQGGLWSLPITYHLSRMKLLSDKLYAFRSFRSTADALLVIKHKKNAELDGSFITRDCFRYFKKFDKVSYRQELHKFSSFGISECVIPAIKSISHVNPCMLFWIFSLPKPMRTIQAPPKVYNSNNNIKLLSFNRTKHYDTASSIV